MRSEEHLKDLPPQFFFVFFWCSNSFFVVPTMQCHLFNVPCGSDLSTLSGNTLCKFWWSQCWRVLHPEQQQHSWGCEYTQIPWSATTAVKRNTNPSHPHACSITVWSWFLHRCWWNSELLNFPEDSTGKDQGLGWSELWQRVEEKYTQTKFYFLAPTTKQQNTIWLPGSYGQTAQMEPNYGSHSLFTPVGERVHLCASERLVLTACRTPQF